MAKLALARKVGVPVPSPIPSDVTHLVAYFGRAGFTPDYNQPDRIALPIADVPRQTVNGVPHFVFDTATLPVTTDVAMDIYFTLADATDAEEGDFSPVISVPLDREPPTTLSQPILLDA